MGSRKALTVDAEGCLPPPRCLAMPRKTSTWSCVVRRMCAVVISSRLGCDDSLVKEHAPPGIPKRFEKKSLGTVRRSGEAPLTPFDNRAAHWPPSPRPTSPCALGVGRLANRFLTAGRARGPRGSRATASSSRCSPAPTHKPRRSLRRRAERTTPRHRRLPRRSKPMSAAWVFRHELGGATRPDVSASQADAERRRHEGRRRGGMMDGRGRPIAVRGANLGSFGVARRPS